jgi:hypothetical protein
LAAPKLVTLLVIAYYLTIEIKSQKPEGEFMNGITARTGRCVLKKKTREAHHIT